MVFDWLRKKDKDKPFKESFLLTEESKPEGEEDPFEKQLIKASPMLIDEHLPKIISNYPYMWAQYIANAPVNRTTKHRDKIDPQVQWIDYKILQLFTEMDMKPSDFDEIGLAFPHALEMFHNIVISDGWEGFKARVLTEIIKKHYITTKD